MTIQHIDPADVATVPAAQNVTGRAMRLVEWAEEARAAHALAQSLVRTPFAGQFKGNVDGATAAILKGAEVGLTPVTALGAFDLIQGTPAPKAITLRALVQSAGHEIIITESTDEKAVAKARRAGSTEWQNVSWTMKQAERLGLVSKDNWRKQPKAMLVARVTSEAARLIGADVILGIGFSAEELTDVAEVKPRRTVKRAELPQTPEPELEPQTETQGAEPEPDADDQPESPLLNTSGQLAKAMFAALGDAGVTDKADRLAYVSRVVGREVTTSKEMTDRDAQAVIEALAVDAEARDQPAEPTFEDAPEPEGWQR